MRSGSRWARWNSETIDTAILCLTCFVNQIYGIDELFTVTIGLVAVPLEGTVIICYSILIEISIIFRLPDTDTDSHIFSHKNNLLTGNNFPNMQYQPKYQSDPYIIRQPQQLDDQIYHEQQQMVRNDWPQMPPQQQQQILQQQQQPPPPIMPIMPQMPKQNSPNWNEKSPKPAGDEKITGHKKEQPKESEYSDEYVEGDESPSEGEDVTTTVAPKKVMRCYCRDRRGEMWKYFEDS